MLQKGDRVFFTDNSKGDQARCIIFQRAVRDLGLEPVFYAGASRAVRESNVDREIREDFYTARALVLYFGSPKEGSDHEDHWVLPEIRHAARSGVPCLAYVSKDFPKEILVKHGYDGKAEVVLSEADFGPALQRDLGRLVSLT
jgi:hypothetical protein